MSGRVIADRFELRRRLGAGGMGVVYEAFDRTNSQTVALKTLQHLSPSGIARFKNEFRALADVIHPNLVALYELVADGNVLFFTMELLQGVDFLAWVRPTPFDEEAIEVSVGPSDDGTQETITAIDTPLRSGGVRGQPPEPTGELDLRRLRSTMRQLAEAVAAIHEAGMLHRDLKPSNVMVEPGGRVTVLDFGLVTSLADEREGHDERARVGTPPFMSPEQGARQPLTAASDWYSVGTMLYRALTGVLPFVGGRDDVLMDKQRFEPPPPAEVTTGIPDDLNALCVELLRREPERRPSGTEVLRRLGSRSAFRAQVSGTSRSSHAAETLLVGRGPHLDRLCAALEAVRDGATVVAHVHGASGMGKTALVTQLVDLAKLEYGAVVLRGRCYEQESVPFKAVDGVVDALGHHLSLLPRLDAERLMPRDTASLARVFPVLRQVEAVTESRGRRAEARDPQELRRRAFQALRELLARLADRHLLVVAIDDTQWGDLDSATLLGAVLRSPDPPPLLLLSSYRSEERAASQFLVSFDRQVAAHHIAPIEVEVGPLSLEDATELAVVHLGETRSLEYAHRIAAESAGSPFFVEELARYAASRGELPSAEAISLDGALRARVRRLPDNAAALLTTIAVAARPIAQDLAVRAAEVEDPGALSLLKAGSFVRSRSIHGSRFVECYHDRIRAAAVSNLGESALRQCHQRLAVILEMTLNADPEMLAAHYQGAGDHERAVRFSVVAAERASAALAFDRAAELYSVALELAPASTPRLPLYMALGDALANSGRGADSAQAYLEASKLATGGAQLDLLRAASQQLLRSGYIDEGLAALGDVLRSVDMALPRTPMRALLSLLASRGRLSLRGLRFRPREESDIPAIKLRRLDVLFNVAYGLAMVDAIRASAFQSRYLHDALRIGEPRRIAYGLAGEAAFISLVGPSGSKRAVRVLALLRTLSAEAEDAALRGITDAAQGIVAFQEGRWADALASLELAERTLRDECKGVNWELSTTYLFSSFSLAFMGRTREMWERLPALVAEAQERGDLYAATTLRASVGFYNYIVADDPEGGIADIDDAMAEWSPSGFHLQHAHELMGKTNLDLYAGNYTRAVQRIRERWTPLMRSQLMRAQVVRTNMWAFVGRAELALGVETNDQALVRSAERRARKLEREDVRYSVGLGRLLRAGVAGARGDLELAARQLAETEELFENCDMVLNIMCARRQRGLLLGGTEGAALVAEADAYFLAQGYAGAARISDAAVPGFGQH